MVSLDKNVAPQKKNPKKKSFLVWGNVSTFCSIFFALAIFNAQNSDAYECKSQLPLDDGSDTVYQNRGNYCEGISPRKFSVDSAVSILGYFARETSFPPGNANEIEVRRHTPPADEMEVYLSSLFPGRNYRLDATLPKNVEGFLWKLDVIRDTRVNLGKGELAALGCAPSCDAMHRVLVPLILAPASDEKENSTPYLIVKFPDETESVQIRFLDEVGVEIAVSPSLERPKFRPDIPRVIWVPKVVAVFDKFTVDLLAVQNNGTPIPITEVLLGVTDDE